MNTEINNASTGHLAPHLADFARALNCGLFGDCGTDVKAAFEYAHKIANASDNPGATLTAVFFVTNTIANLLAEMAGQPNKESENV